MVSALSPYPLAWLRTLKARLMLASALVIAASVLVSASVLLERVEQRSEQAVLDREASHVEQMAGMLGQRVVMLQKMMRGAAEQMPDAAYQDPPRPSPTCARAWRCCRR